MSRLFRIGRSIWKRLYGASRAFGRVLVGNEYASRSYSQYGEDMILRAILARYPSTYPGFYVDVGAHHPMRFSNTRYFYECGWTGICVDPLPEAARSFKQWRPRDLFLQAGVAASEGELTYYMFDEPALNTFSPESAEGNATRLKVKQSVKVYPLRQILGDHLPKGRTIDLLSVDVEGLDVEVLRSNDWVKYRPSIVVIEEMEAVALSDVAKLEAVVFMKSQGYVTLARTPSAVVFADTCSKAFDGGNFLNPIT